MGCSTSFCSDKKIGFLSPLFKLVWHRVESRVPSGQSVQLVFFLLVTSVASSLLTGLFLLTPSSLAHSSRALVVVTSMRTTIAPVVEVVPQPLSEVPGSALIEYFRDPPPERVRQSLISFITACVTTNTENSMGRKRLYTGMVPIIVRIEGQLLRLVDDSAKKQDLSRNSLVTSIIARNFNQLGFAHKETMHQLPNTDTTVTQGIEAVKRDRKNNYTRTRKANEELRAKVIAGYGNRCVCCGESRSRFLNIDHVNGKDGRRGTYLLRYILRHNFPPEYRVLCFNCNLGREMNSGICPHQSLI